MFFTQVCIWLYSGIISTGVFPLEEEILLCPVWKLERAGWCFWGCVEKKSWMRLAYGCLSQSWLSLAILNEPYHKPGFPALRLSWWPKEGWKLDSPELQSRSLPTAWRIHCPWASLEPGTIIPLPAFHLHKISLLELGFIVQDGKRTMCAPMVAMLSQLHRVAVTAKMLSERHPASC